MATPAPAAAALAAVILGALAGGCFSPDYGNGRLQCNLGRCPAGLVCGSGGRCWLPGQQPADGGDAPEEGGQGGEGGQGDSPGEDGGAPDRSEPVEVPEAGGPLDDPRALLAELQVVPGRLDPAFAPTSFPYFLNLPLFTPSLTLQARAVNPAAALSIDGSPAGTGEFMRTFPLAPGGRNLRIQVAAPDSRPAHYSLGVIAGGQTTYLKASNTRPSDHFGATVALWEDTFVIGAPAEHGGSTGVNGDQTDDSGGEVGAVYALSRARGAPGAAGTIHGDRWTQTGYLKPNRSHPGMRFGDALAVAGDLLVVGAPGEDGASRVINGPPDEDADEAGAVYVFVREGASWRQEAYLKASDAEGGDRFGTSVAVSGSTVVVGAPGADQDSGPDAGAAYVFVRAGGGDWTQQALLRATNARGDTEFGHSVALLGDTAVVGAHKEDGGASGVNPGAASAAAGDSGAAYVFARNGASWSQTAYIKAPRNAPAIAFGSRVALSAEWLAVSAPRESSAARGINQDPDVGRADAAGAVFLYERRGSTWEHRFYLKAANAEAGDGFGHGLALSDGPTGGTLLVGAIGEDSNAVGVNEAGLERNRYESGAVYVFRRGEAGAGPWRQVAYLKSPNSEMGDRFGIAVAVWGDTLALGADGEDGSARGPGGNTADNQADNSGAVWVY